MKMTVFIALLFIFILLPGIGSAGEANVLTLEDALEMGLQGNPSIAAAGYATQAAGARPSQAATPPDPEFMLQFTQVPIDTTDVDQGMTEYMIEQKVPFPPKLVQGYKAEKMRAEALKSRENTTVQEIVRQIKRAYTNLWRLQEEEKVNQRTMSLYRMNKGISETAYATLKSGVADPVRASVDMGEIEGQLALIEQDHAQSLANISSLVARPIEPDTKVVQPPEPPETAGVNELLERATAVRPELAEAKSMIASNRADLAKARSGFGPDLTLRWGYLDMPGNLQNAWTGRIGVSVPLWSLSKQRFAVMETKAELKRAESLKVEAEQSVASEIKSAYARLAAAKKIAKVYGGTVVPRARLLLTSSQEAYRTGKGDFLSIIDAIRSLNNAELQLIRARADAVIAYSDLERAVGTSLEGGHFSVERSVPLHTVKKE